MLEHGFIKAFLSVPRYRRNTCWAAMTLLLFAASLLFTHPCCADEVAYGLVLLLGWLTTVQGILLGMDAAILLWWRRCVRREASRTAATHRPER